MHDCMYNILEDEHHQDTMEHSTWYCSNVGVPFCVVVDAVDVILYREDQKA